MLPPQPGLHDLRRSLVNIMAEQGADIAVLDSLLNRGASGTRGGIVAQEGDPGRADAQAHGAVRRPADQGTRTRQNSKHG